MLKHVQRLLKENFWKALFPQKLWGQQFVMPQMQAWALLFLPMRSRLFSWWEEINDRWSLQFTERRNKGCRIHWWNLVKQTNSVVGQEYSETQIWMVRVALKDKSHCLQSQGDADEAGSEAAAKSELYNHTLDRNSVRELALVQPTRLMNDFGPTCSASSSLKGDPFTLWFEYPQPFIVLYLWEEGLSEAAAIAIESW